MKRKEIAEKIKKAIRESGLPQKEIAKIFGVNQTQISKWASGKSQPTLDNFAKMLEVFGKDANYFFENSDTISHSGNISHTGSGDIATGQSSIKKSDNPTSNYQFLLSRIEKLEKTIKTRKK